MLKILSEDYRQAVMFRVCPDVRIEPVQLVSCTSANGIAQNGLIRVEDGELVQEFFRFSQRVGLF
jgi:hypothetical protein